MSIFLDESSLLSVSTLRSNRNWSYGWHSHLNNNITSVYTKGVPRSLGEVGLCITCIYSIFAIIPIIWVFLLI